MKKAIITISVLIIISLLLFIAIRPSEENERKTVSIGKMDLKSFDLYEVLKNVTGEKPENLNLYFEDYSMTVNDKNNVISLNFSFIEQETFKDKKTSVHLYGINDELIVKTEFLDDGKDLTIKEYIYTIFNIGNYRNTRSRLYVEDYLHQDELSDLLKSLKKPFIDDINKSKENFHIELFSRAYYTVYNNDTEAYLVDCNSGFITNVDDKSNNSRIEPVIKDGKVDAYKVRKLGGVITYSNVSGSLKYYFLNED